MRDETHPVGFLEKGSCQSLNFVVCLPLCLFRIYPPSLFLGQFDRHLLLHLVVHFLLDQQALRDLLLMDLDLQLQLRQPCSRRL